MPASAVPAVVAAAHDALAAECGRGSAAEALTAVYVGPRRERSQDEYFLVFANFARVIRACANLKIGSDMRVLLEYCDAMSYGNHVSVSQRRIATSAGLTREAVSRSVQRLLRAGILIGDADEMRLNMTMILRGSIADTMRRYAGAMAESVRVSQDIYGDLIVPPVRLPTTGSDSR